MGMTGVLHTRCVETLLQALNDDKEARRTSAGSFLNKSLLLQMRQPALEITISKQHFIIKGHHVGFGVGIMCGIIKVSEVLAHCSIYIFKHRT